MLLQFAFAGAYPGHQFPKPAEEHLGAQYGGARQEQKHPEQFGRQHQQINRGRDQLHQRDQHPGHSAADQFGHHADIFFQPVDRVPREEAFPSVPPAFHDIAEKLDAQEVPALGPGVVFPPVSPGKQQKLEQEDEDEKTDGRSQRRGLHAGRNVDKVFADHDEQQGYGDTRQADEQDDGKAPADHL